MRTCSARWRRTTSASGTGYEMQPGTNLSGSAPASPTAVGPTLCESLAMRIPACGTSSTLRAAVCCSQRAHHSGGMACKSDGMLIWTRVWKPCRAKQAAKAAEAEEDRLLAEEHQALLAREAGAREAALAATQARSAARAEQAGSGVLEAAKVRHSWPYIS